MHIYIYVCIYMYIYIYVYICYIFFYQFALSNDNQSNFFQALALIIKTEYAIVNIKHKTIDLLKNHVHSKNEAFRE